MPMLNDVSFDVLNSQMGGDVASRLLACNGDYNVLRPWIGEDGRSYISREVIKNGKKTRIAVPIQNTTATLRKDDWLQIDEVVVKAAKERLRAVADLRGAGLTLTIPSGMGKTVLQTETMGDIDPASVNMDGLAEGPNDRPLFEPTYLPLPIIHKDWNYSLRQILVSRNGGSPLDTSHADLAARRVAEEAEKLLLGVSTVADQYAWANGTIYGYTDFPSILTRTITTPTGAIGQGATFLADVMAMKQQSHNALHYGPWVLYVASAWDQFLDDDFKANGDQTIRERVMKINGLQDIRTLDYFTGTYDIVLVQMTQDVVREVMGMDIVTLQWETQGGMQINFKTMAIMVPQLRADINGRTGIVYGAV